LRQIRHARRSTRRRLRDRGRSPRRPVGGSHSVDEPVTPDGMRGGSRASSRNGCSSGTTTGPRSTCAVHSRYRRRLQMTTPAMVAVGINPPGRTQAKAPSRLVPPVRRRSG
jgi:hypothetical protein